MRPRRPRRLSDPEGAITAARRTLESVCKLILDWKDHRHVLPDWGWSVGEDNEPPRCSMGRISGFSRA
jgi:hypothetical protein